MAEYIDRDEAIRALVNLHVETGVKTANAIRILRELHAAETERKTGQWLPSRDRDYNECSVCRRITEPQVVAYKFCPYCGAEMRGEENDRDGKMPRVFLF